MDDHFERLPYEMRVYLRQFLRKPEVFALAATCSLWRHCLVAPIEESMGEYKEYAMGLLQSSFLNGIWHSWIAYNCQPDTLAVVHRLLVALKHKREFISFYHLVDFKKYVNMINGRWLDILNDYSMWFELRSLESAMEAFETHRDSNGFVMNALMLPEEAHTEIVFESLRKMMHAYGDNPQNIYMKEIFHRIDHDVDVEDIYQIAITGDDAPIKISRADVNAFMAENFNDTKMASTVALYVTKTSDLHIDDRIMGAPIATYSIQAYSPIHYHVILFRTLTPDEYDIEYIRTITALYDAVSIVDGVLCEARQLHSKWVHTRNITNKCRRRMFETPYTAMFYLILTGTRVVDSGEIPRVGVMELEDA